MNTRNESTQRKFAKTLNIANQSTLTKPPNGYDSITTFNFVKGGINKDRQKKSQLVALVESLKSAEVKKKSCNKVIKEIQDRRMRKSARMEAY